MSYPNSKRVKLYYLKDQAADSIVIRATSIEHRHTITLIIIIIIIITIIISIISITIIIELCLRYLCLYPYCPLLTTDATPPPP